MAVPRDPESHSAQIRQWVLAQLQKGKSPSELQTAAAFKLKKGSKAVQLAVYEARAIWSVRTDPVVDASSLSLSARKKLEIVVRQEMKRIQAENTTYLREQIDFHIKRLKTQQFPQWEKDAKLARARAEQLATMVNRHQPPLTVEEFMLIHLCIRGDASPEKQHQAGLVLNTKRAVLTGGK